MSDKTPVADHGYPNHKISQIVPEKGEDDMGKTDTIAAILEAEAADAQYMRSNSVS